MPNPIRIPSAEDFSTSLSGLLKGSGGVVVAATAGTDYLAAVNWKNTLHVDPTSGNNATAVKGRLDKPYATITAALAAAVSGDLVLCSPGTHAQGDGRLTIPLGVTLAGCGMFATTITFSGNTGDSANTVLITATRGTGWVEVRDLKVSVAKGTASTAFPIGMYRSTDDDLFPDFTFLVNDVFVDAITDCLYWQNQEGRLIGRRLILRSKWDLIYAQVDGIDDATGFDDQAGIEVYDSHLYYSPDRDNASSGSGPSWGQSVNRARVSLTDSTLIIGGPGTGTNDVATNWLGFNLSGAGGLRVCGLRIFRRTEFGNHCPNFHINVSGGLSTKTISMEGYCEVDFSDVDQTSATPGGPLRIVPRTPTWLRFRISDSSLAQPNAYYWPSAAATSQTFNLLTLPGRCVVESVYLAKRANLTNATTITAEVGIPGNTTKYLPATAVHSGGESASTPTGTPWIENVGDDPVTEQTALKNVQLVIRTTGANISAISGTFDVYIKVSGPGY